MNWNPDLLKNKEVRRKTADKYTADVIAGLEELADEQGLYGDDPYRGPKEDS